MLLLLIGGTTESSYTPVAKPRACCGGAGRHASVACPRNPMRKPHVAQTSLGPYVGSGRWVAQMVRALFSRGTARPRMARGSAVVSGAPLQGKRFGHKFCFGGIMWNSTWCGRFSAPATCTKASLRVHDYGQGPSRVDVRLEFHPPS